MNNINRVGVYTSKERAKRIQKYKAKRDRRREIFGEPTRHCEGRGTAATRRLRLKGKFVKQVNYRVKKF